MERTRLPGQVCLKHSNAIRRIHSRSLFTRGWSKADLYLLHFKYPERVRRQVEPIAEEQRYQEAFALLLRHLKTEPSPPHNVPYVEIWQRDDQDITAWHYRHYGPGEVVEINSIDVQIDIADVYQGLDFEEA